MEHDIPFGNSNRENGPTFLDFPLFLGIFQWDEPTKRVLFTAEPEIPEILTKWKAPMPQASTSVVGWFVGPALFAGRRRLYFFFLQSKGVQIPAGTREIFCLVESGIQEVLLSGIQAPMTRKAKKLIGIQYRGIGIHGL